ncbi:MAG: hypothetical protein DDT27_01174 [Dehalococcoidia bacterium]|nr:hypothetical protein [Chloroflexota bacterium]MBT9162615.1 hypothetical protein [Chloroflexota bacterium]
MPFSTLGFQKAIPSGDNYTFWRRTDFVNHSWHGTKTISNEPSLLVYFTTRLYDYQNPDEERRPWDDPKIIEPKTGESFDWNKPPHK